MINIVGLGAGDENQLTVGVIRQLQSGLPIYLRTDQHPMIGFFKKNNIPYTSFDSCYENHETFEGVYEDIIAKVKEAALKGDLIYATPGHPTVAEYTVKRLLAETKAQIIGGQSFLDPMFAGLGIDPIDGLQVMDALSFDVEGVNPRMHLIVPQVFDQMSASNLKLDLMETYEDEYPICIVKAAGSAEASYEWKKLYELDHGFKLDNLTTIYVPPKGSVPHEIR
ncbi:MAG: SAM-dependent methyltransferase [Turicibacter sp.]|nr:SAM-dependent methyltransferase [Turicibacter sp.]